MRERQDLEEKEVESKMTFHERVRRGRSTNVTVKRVEKIHRLMNLMRM